MRRVIAAVLLVTQASCLTTWQPSPLPLQQTVEQSSHVLVKLRDGGKLKLWDAWARNDSIGGLRRLRSGARWVERERAVPVDSVTSIEVRSADLPYTVLAMSVVTIATLGVLLLLYYETDMGACVATPCFEGS